MATVVTREEAWASATTLINGTVVKVDRPGILPPLTNGRVTLTTHVGTAKRKRNQRRVVTSELALNLEERESVFKGGALEFRNGTSSYSGKVSHSGRVTITSPPGQYTRWLRPPST